MRLTASQLSQAAAIPLKDAVIWLGPLNDGAGMAGVSNAPRWAMWVAQLGHESGSFRRVLESLDYTVHALQDQWPRRYPPRDPNAPDVPSLAESHGRVGKKPADQRAIAIHAYGDRMGNRPGTDDGWRYRGRGLIQVTGRESYQQCGVALRLPLLAQPELLEQPRNAALSAAWYWNSRSLNVSADARDVERSTRIINGGVNGLADRRERYRVACSALGVKP